MSTAGYLSLTDADREAMLDAIGVDSIDDLFEQIPEGVRLDRALDVPEALPEAALVRHLEELAARCVTPDVAHTVTFMLLVLAVGFLILRLDLAPWIATCLTIIVSPPSIHSGMISPTPPRRGHRD